MTVPPLARPGEAGRCRRCSPRSRRARDHAFGGTPPSDFLPEKNAAGSEIDYHVAVGGGLQLIPAGPARDVLADDYARMLADGMLLDVDEPFERLMEHCADIEIRANTPGDADD